MEEARVLVRERFANPGEVTGYAVAFPGDTTQADTPVGFGGGNPAPDLTQPRLLAALVEVVADLRDTQRRAAPAAAARPPGCRRPPGGRAPACRRDRARP